MDELNRDENKSPLMLKLEKICQEIRESWYRDNTDKTEYMIEFTNILKEMLSKDTLEEYFENDEKLLSNFMGEPFKI
jgi:hypothetical protein